MFVYKCLKCCKDTASPKIEVSKLIAGSTVTLYCDHCDSFDFKIVVDDSSKIREKSKATWRDSALSKLREQSNKDE